MATIASGETGTIADATISDTAGTQLRTVLAEGSATIADSTIDDTDGNQLGTVKAEGVFVLVEDINIRLIYPSDADSTISFTAAENEVGGYDSTTGAVNLDSLKIKKNSSEVSLPFDITLNDDMDFIITRTSDSSLTEVTIDGTT